MLTLEQCRKLDPTLYDVPDAELLIIRDKLYELSTLAFEDWWAEKQGSKYPTGALPQSNK